MGYRYNIPLDKNDEPIKPENMLLRFDVRNGAVMRVAFDCRYCTKDIDHPFWLFPRYPGDTAVARRSNGYPYYRWRDVRWPYENTPIDLTDDNEFSPGAQVIIEFEDNAPVEAGYIKWYGMVDSEDTNIIRIGVKTNFPVFSDKPIENRFTVFICNPDNEYMSDAVCHGILVVLPGRAVTIIEPQEQEVQA